MGSAFFVVFFFFNDTAPTEIYTLSLHDALPISADPGDLRLTAELALGADLARDARHLGRERVELVDHRVDRVLQRSEEHTSELQSRQYLVCRLLLEKKKN